MWRNLVRGEGEICSGGGGQFFFVRTAPELQGGQEVTLHGYWEHMSMFQGDQEQAFHSFFLVYLSPCQMEQAFAFLREEMGQGAGFLGLEDLWSS